MAISTAVGEERISRIVGYKLTKGNFQETSPNLPQRIAIHAEANAANQASITEDPFEFTTSQEVGALYGYGSPIHQIARILRPATSEGVGGIPTLVYPQKTVGGEVAAARAITISSLPTAPATHTIVINGREGLESGRYDILVDATDTNITIFAKIADAINAVLEAPVIAVADAGVDAVLTAKWEGVTSEELNISIIKPDTDTTVYGIASEAVGAGARTPDAGLAKYGNDWNTVAINGFGIAALANYETFNGVPDPAIPTGRYAGIIFKPLIAMTGSVISDKDTLAAITDAAARKDQVTNVICPAPNSSGWTHEAAANCAALYARIMQDTPHLDVTERSYPDMPVPADGDIGDMTDYNNRDFLVKKGSSTVDFKNGRYVIQDFVTTYHPDGETPPQFRYARNLNLDFNVRYSYFLLEGINVIDHSVAENDQPVRVDKTIKPKQWVQIIDRLADDLAERNLIVEPEFMQDSIEVGTSLTNPDRLETFYKYKRSPYVRIASTTVEAGFSFGLE